MNYDPNYNNVHKWLTYNHGKASRCERCKGKNKRYEYALIRGYKYEKKRENFIELCKPCHALYDNVIERMTEKKYKPVYAVKDGKTFYFPSCIAAAAETGVLKTSISNVLHGRALSAGGYKWKYA